MNENELIVIRAFSGLGKEAADKPCPGSKIRSKGEGRGLGIGGGKGPIGVPARRLKNLDNDDVVNVCPTPGAKIRSEGKGRGLGIGKGRGPVGIPIRTKGKKYNLRYKKKATIVKESLAGNSDKDAVDVEVERITPTHVKAANEAVANMTEDPNAIRPSGVSNAAVAKVSLLRSKAKAEKAKQDQLSQIGGATFGKGAAELAPPPASPPEMSTAQQPTKYKFGQFSSELLRLLAEQIQNKKVKDALEGAAGKVEGFDLGSLLPKTAAAIPGQGGQGQSGQPDPYAAMEQMQQDIGVVQKAIPGMNADAILQGQQAGLDMTPGGIKKRIGAHEMIAKGKKILKDENKNGVPDIAEASMGGNPDMMQQQGQPELTAMAKLRTPDLTKIADDEDGAETPQEEAAESLDPEVMQQLLNVIAEKGQSIDDEDVHSKAESMGVNPHEAEEQIYRTLAELMGGKNDIIPGGLAAGMPTSMFPQDQIAKGTEVELEHSSNPALAQEIAKDHLTEGNDYYEPRLENLEKSMDKARESGKIEATGEGTEKHTENKERKDQDVETLKESALDRVQELVKNSTWLPYHREQTKLLKEHYTPENMAKFREWNKTQPMMLGGNPFMSWLRETNPEVAAGIDAKMKPIEERLRTESKEREAARRKRNPKLWNPGSLTNILRWSKLRRKLPKGAFHVGGGKFVSESDLADMAGKQNEARQSLKNAAAQDAKKKEEEEETKPGIEFLASASDTPPKKAPTKKPEEESENEGEEKEAGLLSHALAAYGGYKGYQYLQNRKKQQAAKAMKPKVAPTATTTAAATPPVVTDAAGVPAATKLAALNPEALKAAFKMAGKIARKGVISKREAKSPIAKHLRTATKTAGDMGEGSAVPKTMSDLPLRDGFKGTHRQDIFDDVSKWSLGARI